MQYCNAILILLRCDNDNDDGWMDDFDEYERERHTDK